VGQTEVPNSLVVARTGADVRSQRQSACRLGFAAPQTGDNVSVGGNDDSRAPIVVLLLTPLLVVAFACGTIGSFLIWQARIMRSLGTRRVPFDLHLFHNESNTGMATVACILGLLSLMLPADLVATVLTHG
jgi:hypothetical protein